MVKKREEDPKKKKKKEEIENGTWGMVPAKKVHESEGKGIHQSVVFFVGMVVGKKSVCE